MEEIVKELSENLEYIKYELKDNKYYIYCKTKTREFKHPTKEIITNKIKTKYTKKVYDLPIAGKLVILIIEAKVFYFPQLKGEKNQFAEQLDFLDTNNKINYKTKRLTEYILDICHNTSAISAEKTLKRNGIKISDTTINRLIKKKLYNKS